MAVDLGQAREGFKLPDHKFFRRRKKSLKDGENFYTTFFMVYLLASGSVLAHPTSMVLKNRDFVTQKVSFTQFLIRK